MGYNNFKEKKTCGKKKTAGLEKPFSTGKNQFQQKAEEVRNGVPD